VQKLQHLRLLSVTREGEKENIENRIEEGKEKWKQNKPKRTKTRENTRRTQIVED
jgi:hypothetical protein